VIPEGVGAQAPRHRNRGPVPPDEHYDVAKLSPAFAAIEAGEALRLERRVSNVDRTVGGRLSHAVVSRHGPHGLIDDQITIHLEGSAGQSFGAWLAPGITLELEGEANDYVGKGLSGGVLAIHPPEQSPFAAEENVITGNVALYGATGGRAFFNGLAGERFAVRNSGAIAVVEGVGEHGCEYMTGGRVAILGPTGHNFAAGMSGGIAWVHDPEGHLPVRANTELVDLESMESDEVPELHALVVEHFVRTGSAVAEKLLERWPAALEEFVRVIPREYAMALARREAQGDPQTSEFRTLAA
jgi:glutamate synthase (NADPH/NADH) large chain